MSQKLDKTAIQILKTIRNANSPVSRSVLKGRFREKISMAQFNIF